jgi:gluconolactonase
MYRGAKPQHTAKSVSFLSNPRKTECGAGEFPANPRVRIAPFARPKRAESPKDSAARILRIALAVAVLLDLVPLQSPLNAADADKAVVRLDPALDAIVSTAAHLEMLKSDYFGISEGPLWIQKGSDGYLLFSDIGANAIYKWTPQAGFSIFLPNAGYTGDMAAAGFQGFGANNGRLIIMNFGPNGIVADPQGRLIFCAQGDRAIVRIESNGSRTVLADKYEGKRLNRPNDLVLKSDGAIYFTDPVFFKSPVTELPGSSVFMLKDGKLSPDEKYLYVNDTVRKLILRYEVRADDTIANGRTFVGMTSDKTPGAPDGMKVDAKGNLYCTGPGGIWIISPGGKRLGTILLPETGTNLTFGDADGRMLYIADRRSLARIRLNVAGALWKSAR